MNTFQTYLARLWGYEYTRTTGKSNRRMVYAKGWFKIQSYWVDVGWQDVIGSTYREEDVRNMVDELMRRPDANS